MIDVITQKIKEFDDSGRRNAWLFMDELQVYVRNGQRLGTTTFDVATVNVNESERGKGWFTAFLDVLEGQGRRVYVEQILNPRLIPYLEKRGYKSVNYESMYKDCSLQEPDSGVGYRDCLLEDNEKE